MTARQAELVRLIKQHHRAYGFPPSVRELMAAAERASMSTVHKDLVALRDEGLIEWDQSRYRTIRVTSNA